MLVFELYSKVLDQKVVFAKAASWCSPIFYTMSVYILLWLPGLVLAPKVSICSFISIMIAQMCQQDTDVYEHFGVFCWTLMCMNMLECFAGHGCV